MTGKKKHGWGITGKVFTIATIMILAFFIIVMVFQFLISGYEVIKKGEEGLSGKLSKASSIIEEFDFSEWNPYAYESKQLLADLRRDISDESAVCEFIITNADGEIVSALHNEIAFYSFRDVYVKYAYFDNIPISDLYTAIMELQKVVDASAIRPEVVFRGEILKDSYVEQTYYAYQCYEIGCEDVVYLDNMAQAQTNYPESIFMDVSGKYYGEFITGAVATPEYTAHVNENREALIAAVSEGNIKESQNLMEAVYYRTIHVDQDYAIVMRMQLHPLESVFSSMKDTYFALAILAFAFSTWIAVIFSRMIVKPVQKIDEKAKKLAALDFSTSNTYEYNRQDEIGSLYTSVNTLAVNLDRAIAELQEKNRQLSRDIALERELDAKRREFTAATSHELKTPLARLRGYAEALQLNLSEEKKDKYCKSLMEEVDLMNGLILEMLSLSKLETQQYEDLNLDAVDLLSLTRAVTERFQKLVQDKQLGLKITCLQGEMFVNCDYEKIERVVTNFVDNAVHYTPEGKQIEISIAEEGDKVLLAVENEGSHIEEEALPHIWDSFYKVDKARTKEKRSVTAERTGLGLSIVRAILQLHKAEFGAENTETGVKFYFYLDKP